MIPVLHRCILLGLILIGAVSSLDAQAQQKLLTELWGNAECAPCGPIHTHIVSLRDANPGRVILVGFSASHPSPTDPLYLEDPEELNYLMDFYDIIGVPDLRSNGGLPIDSQVGVDSVLAQTVPLELQVQGEIGGSTLTASVDVFTLGTPPSSDSLVLRVAVRDISNQR